MRRGSLLLLGLALTSAIVADGASARPRTLPNTLFGIVTAPFDAILGSVGHVGRHPHHRRPNSARSNPVPARAADAPVPPASIPRSAATGAGTSNRTAKAAALDAELPTTVTRTGTIAATAGAAAASAAGTPNEAGAQPIPTPAPRPRSAALATPSEGSQDRSDSSPKSARDPTKSAREPSLLGVAGPLAWPGAYEDVIGFTLWPQIYGERLRVRGISEVMSTLFTPTSTLVARTRVEFARATDSAATTDTVAAEPSGACANASQATPDWPASQIERLLQLTSEQRGALDRLKATFGEAIAAIRTAACRDQAAVSPVERLRSMQNTLWAVRDAAILVRAPFARFFDLLTDAQKKQFIIPAPQSDLRAMAMSAQGAAREEFARMCGMSRSSDLPMRQVEQFLQPTGAQRASLDNLQKKSFEMAQFLMASCLQPIPTTPTARLDAATDRLTAVIFATSHISLALNDLYNQLSDQQKAKINSVGR